MARSLVSHMTIAHRKSSKIIWTCTEEECTERQEKRDEMLQHILSRHGKKIRGIPELSERAIPGSNNVTVSVTLRTSTTRFLCTHFPRCETVLKHTDGLVTHLCNVHLTEARIIWRCPRWNCSFRTLNKAIQINHEKYGCNGKALDKFVEENLDEKQYCACYIMCNNETELTNHLNSHCGLKESIMRGIYNSRIDAHCLQWTREAIGRIGWNISNVLECLERMNIWFSPYKVKEALANLEGLRINAIILARRREFIPRAPEPREQPAE